ncbi:MAG: GntR family transcriptional regulator [Chloroflexota bacterium]
MPPASALRSVGPLHARTADALRMRIVQGIWRPGDRLPSQEELCDEFGVSSITMRRSVGSLVAEGLLVRLQGKGTFVSADHDIVQGPPQLTSFTQDMKIRGWRSTARTLEADVRRASPDTATKLGLPPNALVAVIRRVRSADDEPLAIQVAHLPATLFPGLEFHVFDKQSLYQVLERVYGVRPATASERYNASRLSVAESRLLDVAAGSPAFRVERVTSDSAGRRIELVQSVIRGDRYTLAIQLSARREPS